MKQKRPINLDLGTLKYPPMAIASILHRISGILLFLLMPLILYGLHQSLLSEQSFVNLQTILLHPFNKFIIWVIAACVVYHVLAGFRHMIMDLGFGEGLIAGRRSALFVIIVSIVLTIALGIWLW